MAAPITTTTQVAGPVNVVFQETLLRNAKAKCPYFVGSVPAEIREHSGSFTAKWRRIENLTPVTAALAELTGNLAIPVRDSVQPSVTDITKAVSKYGNYMLLNEEVDVVNFTGQSDKLVEILGINAGMSLNRLQRDEMEDNATAIKMATEAGFNVETTYIYGLPGENFEDRLEALRFARDMGVSRARFNNITPYPGTTMYTMAKENGGLKIEADWDNFSSAAAVTAGLKKRYGMPYVPPDMTEREMKGTVFLANLLFYLNYSHLKALLNPSQKGSGKWFSFPWKDLLNPLKVIDLGILATTVFLRAAYYPIVEKKCRKFFIKALKL